MQKFSKSLQHGLCNILESAKILATLTLQHFPSFQNLCNIFLQQLVMLQKNHIKTHIEEVWWGIWEATTHKRKSLCLWKFPDFYSSKGVVKSQIFSQVHRSCFAKLLILKYISFFYWFQIITFFFLQHFSHFRKSLQHWLCNI